MNDAAAEPESRLGRAVRLLAERTADMQIGEALDALIAKRDDLRRWIEKSAPVGEAGNLDDALADLRERLGLGPEESEESVSREICDALDWSGEYCRQLAAGLGGASQQDRSRARAKIFGRSSMPASRCSRPTRRVDFFLTSDGSAGSKARSAPHRFGAETRRARATLETDFAAEAERVLRSAAAPRHRPRLCRDRGAARRRRRHPAGLSRSPSGRPARSTSPT